MGYDKPLYILAFDHRASFAKKMFGVAGKPSPVQTKNIADAKMVIFEGFCAAVKAGIPKESAAVLVDEQFGDAVLRQARKEGYLTCLAAEKSGKDDFEFEYGENFEAHIEKYRPNFVKALIRYNPQGNKVLNASQRTRLKILADFCHKRKYLFLIEPLIPPTDEQLAQAGDDEERYDLEIRPELMVDMIEQLQEGGVEPDVWKIEGLEMASEYEGLVQQAQAEGRKNVGVVVLGRGGSIQQVEDWVGAAKNVKGMTGFAIGRTIWWEPLEKWRKGSFSRQEAVAAIAESYLFFYKKFTS